MREIEQGALVQHNHLHGAEDLRIPLRVEDVADGGRGDSCPKKKSEQQKLKAQRALHAPPLGKRVVYEANGMLPDRASAPVAEPLTPKLVATSVYCTMLLV